MAPRNAGPAGSGLLPPGFEGSEGEERDDEQNAQHGDEEDVDLEGVPPVEGEDDEEEDDGNDGSENDGDEEDSDGIEARIEAKFQRKFDQAISRMHRNLERKYAQKETPKEEEGDDEPPVHPAGSSTRSTDRRRDSSSVTSIRLLAREFISEEMEDAGKQERLAVRKVVDEVLPYVDWSQVDDQEGFVEGLVTKLKSVSTDLVKTGSDRKVAQLKKAGIIQERPGQPGSVSQSKGRTQVGKKLDQGASAAARRFPGGSRSLHSR